MTPDERAGLVQRGALVMMASWYVVPEQMAIAIGGLAAYRKFEAATERMLVVLERQFTTEGPKRATEEGKDKGS